MGARPGTSRRRARLRSWASRLPADRRGGAIVEFALVATPLLFLIFGTLEIGLIFVANVNLSNATSSLSRQIRVGRVVAGGASLTTSTGSQMDLSDFKSAICNNMAMVPVATCMTQLFVDVRTQTSYQSLSSPNPLLTSNFNAAGFCFYSGTPGSVVTVRAYYLWPIRTAFLFGSLTGATSYTDSNGRTYPGNYYVLYSSEIFKNEPNASTTNSGLGC